MPTCHPIRLTMLIAIAMTALCMTASPTAAQSENSQDSSAEIEIKVKLQNVQDVKLLRNDEGELRYRVTSGDGNEQHLTPNEFAELIYNDNTAQPWWKLLLNITSPFGLVWVSVGLLGQVLFTGRMVVQWLVSEKAKKSVVPTAFWWMSLTGATMLIIYFIWRQDVVGILGQATGWFIYIRNLYMIYRDKRQLTPSKVADEK